MGILTFTARIHDLLYQKSHNAFKVMKITRKIMDLQRYATTIANGKVEIGDLLNAGNMRGKTMQYLGVAHNYALNYTRQQEQGMAMYMQPFLQSRPVEEQQFWMNHMRKKLYQEGRDQVLKMEERNLKIEEERLTQEKERLVTLGQEIEAELKAAREARDASIKEMAPKYTFA